MSWDVFRGGQDVWRRSEMAERYVESTARHARLQRDAIDRIYDATRAWATKRAILKLYRATPAEAMRGPIEELAALDRPALALWGTDDAYLPWQFAERQRMAFPSARVELLEGVGHWAFHEDPARVAELLIPFLREQVAAPVT